jgi:predicted transcriptional regulator
MPAEKSVAVSFRVSPRFKQLLEAAAQAEHRSQTNMLETLLFDFCDKRHIEPVRPQNALSQPGQEQ